MPEVEPLRFPSRDGDPHLQDDAEDLSKALVPNVVNVDVATKNNEKTEVDRSQDDLQMVCPSRRRSCALVNTLSPCVNKAIYHIEELNRKIEGRRQQTGKYHSQISQERLLSEVVRFPSTESKFALLPPELFVEGVGLCSGESGTLTLQNETRDVLTEVMYLIGRLEADRQEAEDALKVEKERNRTLVIKIDCLSLWKQQNFPAAVQKEHEACARDISELIWHHKLRRERLELVKTKLVHTEILNQRLNEDIAFIKKHDPLVKEKLELESSIMTQIKNAQIEANETFSKTFVELKSVQQAFTNEELKADKEREDMTHQLNAINSQLKEKLKDFDQLQSHWAFYSGKVKETEEKIAFKKKLWKVLSKQIPQLEEQEALVNDQVMELHSRIEDKSELINRLKEDISELLKQIQFTKYSGESNISKLDEKLSKKRQDVLALHDENKECELEMEDYTRNIFQSVQAVKQLHKDWKRMLENISKNEEQRDKAKGELSQVATLHSASKAKLEDLEQQTLMEDQRMRKAAENVKKQMMSEMKELAILKGKIATIKMDLQQEQTSTEKMRKELEKEFEKALSTTRKTEMEVENLRIIYKGKNEKIEDLRQKLVGMNRKHKNTAYRLEQKKDTQKDHFSAVQEMYEAVSEQFGHTLSQIEDLRKKSKDYRTESDIMEKEAATIPHIIEELQTEFDSVEFKHKTAGLIINSFLSGIANSKNRTRLSEETHASLFTDRQLTMYETEDRLKISLRENAELAQEYTDLQKAILFAKREAASAFDRRNLAEASFHDYRQLSLLQKRMHKARVKHFKHRSLYSQAGLAKIQALSDQNNQIVVIVQEDLSKAIQRISAFLRYLTDDSTTVDNAEANKQPGLDGDLKDKKKPRVQITA